MSITANVTININFSGDITYTQDFDADANIASPGSSITTNLASGANTITVPTGATGVLIVPPASNAVTLTLKGVTGDTGIAVGLISPIFLSLNSVSTFVITAGSAVTVRLIWS